MSKVYIGIDPGKTGAVAIIRGEEILIFDFTDHIALKTLKDFRSRHASMHAVLESVHAFPGQGVTSCFSFGTAFGWWKGALDTMGIPYDLITPVKWQREMYDSTKPIKKGADKASKAAYKKALKNYNRERAGRLYPDAQHYLARKMDHNRADALLIAGYCQRIKEGRTEDESCFDMLL